MAIRITRAVVPSLFTVLNMFSGFMSILHASRGEFVPAAWFIVLAAGFDGLDGVMARITKSSSQFGVEIDSLSDVVSFGAAPAFLVHQMYLGTLGGFGIFLSSLLMIFGGLRLARFNVQLVGFDKDVFVGLPIPISAMTVVAFTLNYLRDDGVLDPGAAVYLPWLVVVLSVLMVSKVKYDTVPRPSLRAVREQPLKYGLILVAAILAVVTSGRAMFPLLLAFVAFGIVRGTVRMVRQWGKPSDVLDDGDMVESSQIDR